MEQSVIHTITKPSGRKILYHFTRTSNLPFIALHDTLLSSARLDPSYSSARRTTAKVVSVDGLTVTLNGHLRIPDSMMDEGVTQEQFRDCLNRHVFFWPTLTDCRKMVDTYARSEPDESFAVLAFDAYSLIEAHYAAVKLTKYDSGSAPRFPASCSYRKSPDMFLPIDSFKRVASKLVPERPSDIHEVLIEGQVSNVSAHLRMIYSDSPVGVPERWKHLAKPLAELKKP